VVHNEKDMSRSNKDDGMQMTSEWRGIKCCRIAEVQWEPCM